MVEMNNRILVIDDMSEIHDDYRHVLTPPNTHSAIDSLAADILDAEPNQTLDMPSFIVDCASQGQEGLAMVKKALEEGKPYAAAFVDVRMPPGWDGIETIKNIWKVDPDIQVTIVTAYSDYSWGRIGQELGATDQLLVLKKPFESIEIQQISSSLTHKWNLIRMLKAQERATKESEERYLDLYENSPDMYVSVEASTAHVLTCNQTLLNKLGYKKEEVIGSPIFDLYHPDCLVKVHSAFKSFVDTGEVHNAELQLMKNDGSKIDVSLNVSAIRDENGMVLYSRSCWVDITERKAAEATAKRFSEALKQSGEAVVITDTEGHITHVNRAFTEITGYSEEEVLGKNPKILSSGKHDYEFYKSMWATLEHGDVWHGKVIDKKKDGDDYSAMLTISPIKDDFGKIVSYIGVQQSLEQYELLEEKFHQAQKMEAIGTLVGGIAHDFNNVLAGIVGNLYLIKKQVQELPDAVARVETIEKLSFSAASTINQLLAFSRKGNVEMKTFSISLFLKEAIKLVRASMPENIDIQLEVIDADMQIEGDVNQLQQVILNLLNNAGYAVQTKDSPLISVTLDRFRMTTGFMEKFEGLKKGEYAVLSVTDNGIGIAEENVDKVFEPFFTTKPEGLGSGLGLAMAYGSIEAHQGAIEISSSQGVNSGTTVRIYLPLIDAEKVYSIKAADDGLLHGKGELILLVDDNQIVRETAKDVLEGIGYEVLTAEDGVQAVETYKLHKDEIDMVILDIVMPRMGGIDALEGIKGINPNVKAMFATGYDKLSKQGIKNRRISERVISKPFAVEELSKIIRDILG